jgi:hypothetical protein
VLLLAFEAHNGRVKYGITDLGECGGKKNINQFRNTDFVSFSWHLRGGVMFNSIEKH